MVSGIVLAGGTSSRMATNKLLMTFRGKPLLSYVIDTLRTVVDEIVVVTGHYHQEISAFLASYQDIRVVCNNDYAKGMFTSVKTGAKAAKGDLCIIPGDYPLVSPRTYVALLAQTGLVRVPVFQGRRGHPLFLEEKLQPLLLAEPDDGNLKQFRDRYPITDVVVDDEGVIRSEERRVGKEGRSRW